MKKSENFDFSLDKNQIRIQPLSKEEKMIS